MNEARPHASRWSMVPLEKKRIYLEKHRLQRYAQTFERWRRGERIKNYDTRWLRYLAQRLKEGAPPSASQELGLHDACTQSGRPQSTSGPIFPPEQ
jgi:hypothetical protein